MERSFDKSLLIKEECVPDDNIFEDALEKTFAKKKHHHRSKVLFHLEFAIPLYLISGFKNGCKMIHKIVILTLKPWHWSFIAWTVFYSPIMPINKITKRNYDQSQILHFQWTKMFSFLCKLNENTIKNWKQSDLGLIPRNSWNVQKVSANQPPPN